MKNRISLLLSLFALVIFLPQCKKPKAPDVYFKTASATGTPGGTPTVVTIEFSEANEEFSELTFESVGATPIRFGTYNTVCMRDDSQKLQVTVDNQAFIDSAGHVKLSPGVKSLTLTFVPEYNGFARTAADFAVKISGAKNAAVRDGSNVFTYHTNHANATIQLSSTLFYSGLEHANKLNNDTVCVDTIVQRTGIFTLSGYTLTRNNNGKFDFDLNYSYTSGNSGRRYLRVRFTDTTPFGPGPNAFNCTNNGITIESSPPTFCGQLDNTLEYFTESTAISCTNTGTGSYGYPADDVYGNHLLFAGNMNMSFPIMVNGENGIFSVSGTLNSQFLVY